jgi:hypothetical protein
VKELADIVGYKWLKKFGEVVQLNKSIKFEEYSNTLNQWFEVKVYSLHKNNQFIAIISDITERKDNEKALKIRR